jgi:anti-sigma B factor antagonist
MSLLGISVEAGASGPLMRLSGESDLTTAGQLSDALSAQLASGAPHLTMDLSALRFADSATFRVLIEACRAFEGAGGALELLNPQPAVAQAIQLLGIDQVLTIRASAGSGDHPVIP